MLEKRNPIPVHTAVQRVSNYIRTLDTVEKNIDNCDGYILAASVIADHDIPPFDRSPYDGFAILAKDTAEATREHPVKLEVIEKIGAGDVANHQVVSGKAIRIMTGAALPKGADAIVKLELTREDGNHILINRPFWSGDNLSLQGEDAKKGTKLLDEGRKITSGVKAVLATFGYSRVKVYKKPTVGVIATGSELLDVDDALVPGKIRNSNAYMIMSQIKNAGGEPVNLGRLADDLDASYSAVKGGLDKVDVLITTGGVSVGDFDFLPEIYNKLGAEVLFNKIAMRPGSVTTVARLGDKLLFGLSGNPSACFVGFELFAAPYIKGIQGNKKPYLTKMKAVLDHDFPKANPFTRFVRAKVDWNGGSEAAVAPVGLDKSNSVVSLADTNALMVLPGGTKGFKKGSMIDVLLLFGEGSERFDLEDFSNHRF
ncbi:MAG: gephyrin-like molybdotransferase Glp [Tuberibacillus sp.]